MLKAHSVWYRFIRSNGILLHEPTLTSSLTKSRTRFATYAAGHYFGQKCIVKQTMFAWDRFASCRVPIWFLVSIPQILQKSVRSYPEGDGRCPRRRHGRAVRALANDFSSKPSRKNLRRTGENSRTRALKTLTADYLAIPCWRIDSLNTNFYRGQTVNVVRNAQTKKQAAIVSLKYITEPFLKL